MLVDYFQVARVFFIFSFFLLIFPPDVSLYDLQIIESVVFSYQQDYRLDMNINIYIYILIFISNL